MRFAVGFAFAAIGLILSQLPARSATAAICDPYAKEAAAKAKGVRDFGCGYDVKNPRWTTDRKSHASWCRASPENTVAAETAQRRGAMQVCVTCRVYADAAAKAAAENSKRNCGYVGPRWTADAAAHFAWCMSLPRNDASSAAPAEGLRQQMQKTINVEVGERVAGLVSCKSR